MGEKRQGKQWKVYAFEFLTIFAGITIAFLLNNWNENRKDRYAEIKILMEIRNGLQLDMEDFQHNIAGHQKGIEACRFFRSYLNNEPIVDSLANEQFIVLLRDFVSIQNTSGYQSLRSRGLELISDDSLRMTIINMYEFNFQVIEKLEENYQENQFFNTYFESVHEILAPAMIYSDHGQLIGLRKSENLTPVERSKMMTYLSKIEFNRQFIIKYYQEVNSQSVSLINQIERKLDEL
jgi:hypothetical protein